MGQNCSLGGCNALDFLPITCNLCGQVFCKVHASYDAHQCPKWSPKDAAAADTSKTRFETHKYACHFPECQVQEKVEIICPKCKRRFCLSHRIEQDHDCQVKAPEYMPKTAILVANLTASAPPPKRPPKTVKNQKLAAKIQLMKIKMNAVGRKDLAAQDRLFFKIVLPLGKTPRSKSVYVAKTWSLGKCLDVMADLCNVANRNNTSDPKKLKLLRHCDGQLVNQGTLDTTLDELLSREEVFNGDTLILEYLVDDEMSVDASAYVAQ